MDNPTSARPPARTEPADPPLTGSPTVAPMRILDARRHISADGEPRLTVLVDRIPGLQELTYQVIDLGGVRPLPPPLPLLYVGGHPDGYVTALVDLGDRRGFYGQTLRLPMRDGTVATVVGPHPASCQLVTVFAPNLGVRTDVGLLDDRQLFDAYRDGRGAIPAGLTPEVAQTCLDLAIGRHRAERSHPARAFHDLDMPAAPGDADQGAQP